MRQAKREITDVKILEEILKKSSVCRIAMSDGEIPYILPFNYGYSDNCIYIHCAKEGKKLVLLRKNNKVCFEVEQRAEIIRKERACGWETLFRSIIGYGEVEFISDFAQKEEALKILMLHNGATGDMPFEKKNVDLTLILKITISEMTGKQSGNWEKIRNENLLNLESERLSLIEITEDDLTDIHRLHSIPEVEEFNTIGIPETLADTVKLMQPAIDAQREFPRKSYTWKILLKDSGEFIGLAGMFLSNDKFRLGEMYYKFFPEFWGNGYATETCKLLIQTGFEKMNLHKVEAGVATGNAASIRVLEKSGMKKEGLRRKILPIRGEWVDNYHYAVVEDEI